MITQINHIGIAVNNIEKHIPFYRDILRIEFRGYENVSDQKVKVAIFRSGEVQIELLEPTSPDTAIAKFLEINGEGIHHIAFQTNSIENEIQFFKDNNITMIDETPRNGTHDTKIAFIHPKSSGKVLTEICQLKGEINE